MGSTQGGLYAGWALHRVGSTQGGLYAGWALHRVGSTQGGLYTGWALHRVGGALILSKYFTSLNMRPTRLKKLSPDNWVA